MRNDVITAGLASSYVGMLGKQGKVWQFFLARSQ
jgi:hypothetical protein